MLAHKNITSTPSASPPSLLSPQPIAGVPLVLIQNEASVEIIDVTSPPPLIETRRWARHQRIPLPQKGHLPQEWYLDNLSYFIFQHQQQHMRGPQVVDPSSPQPANLFRVVSYNVLSQS